MADSKLTALTAETAPVGADLIYLVDDVAGTPTSKKATVTDLAASAPFSGTYAPLSTVFNTPKPTGALFENFSRYTNMTNAGVLVSARENLCAIWLPAGVTVTSITFVSATTAASVPTNQWFTLRDSSRNLLRVTVDDTTTAWAANAAKTLALSSTFVTTYTGLHYIGLMVKATTVPSFQGITSTVTAAQALAPVLSGPDTTNTGLSTPATAPNPSAALTQSTAIPYCYVS